MMGRPEDDLQLEKQADYRGYTLSGTHYEMGRQWGMIARAEEVHSLTPAEAAETAPVAPEAAKDEEPALSPSQLSFAEECLQVVCNFHPPLLDELEGWCQALGASIDSALGMLSFGIVEDPCSCSAFACQTKDGVVVGRNYDFFHWARTRHLIQARPDIYYATVGMNDGLFGGRDEGVNEKGLFVALNRAMARAPTKVRPGVIFHLVPRILLETCATAGEAGMLAREMPHLMSHCYLVADPQKMLVVEAHPDIVRVREPEDGYIAVTNHYLHPDLQALMESPNQENSELRLRSILKGLEEANRDDAFWGTAQAILKDHETPLCVHTDELATLWSMVADLTDQRVAYSLGAPCRNAFEKVPWPGASHNLPSEENT